MVRILALLSCCLLFGCASSPGGQPLPAPPPDGHNAQNALDWAGTYEGILPCADCPGIEATLQLHPDQSYELEYRYQERHAAPLIEQGSFRWLPDGNTIELDTDERPTRFFVSENRVFLLDREGKRVTGALADHYVLHKVAEPSPQQED